MRLTINQREADRHERRRDKIREKRVGGHLLKVSAELHCYHRSGRSARTDDADEQSLEQDKVIAPHIECENKSHSNCNEQYLEQSHTPMPAHRAQLMEVDLAKSYEKHKEHKHRQARLAYRGEEVGSLI